MIGIINVLLVLLFLIIVPFILGLLLERFFDKSEGNMMISRCFVLGFSVMLGVFQLVSVPIIKIGTSFDVLMYVYVSVICVLLAISLYTNAKSIKSRITGSITSIKNDFISGDLEQKILFIAALLFIAFETSLLLIKMHTDTDDSRFLAEALEAVEKNTILKFHPITGDPLEVPIGEMRKDVASPFPFFIAVFSVLTRMHPTVLAHAVFPALLVPLAFSGAYMIGKYLLEDKKHIATYMFILSVVVLFSFESIYSWGYTLLAIIWQGRSIFAVIILPLLWYVLMTMYSDNTEKGMYLVLITVVMASACLSGMGIVMTPLVTGAFALAQVFKTKKIVPAIYMMLCVVPCLIYIVICYDLTWIIK